MLNSQTAPRLESLHKVIPPHNIGGSLQVAAAAFGLVLMQTSVALFELGLAARVGALALGFGFIVWGALRTASLLPRRFVTQLALVALLCALGFEALSALNEHLVFESKLIVFRAICYILIFCGALLGMAPPGRMDSYAGRYAATAIAVVVAIAAPLTWRSLQGYIIADGTRGSFEDSSPVALGFSGGTLAVAALAVALRSPRIADYVIGTAGFAGWVVICLQSGSRGSLLFLLLTTLLLSVAWIRFAWKRIGLLFAVAAALLTGVVAVDSALANQSAYVLERFEAILRMETDASLAGGAFSRAYLLQMNLNLPGLLIMGGESFDPATYPHNFAVEAAVRLGVWVGSVFLIGVLYLLWVQIGMLWRMESSIPLAVIISMGLFTFLNAQTNLMWELLRPLWFAVGIALGAILSRGRV